jgi:hypothetical protein
LSQGFGTISPLLSHTYALKKTIKKNFKKESYIELEPPASLSEIDLIEG